MISGEGKMKSLFFSSDFCFVCYTNGVDKPQVALRTGRGEMNQS